MSTRVEPTGFVFASASIVASALASCRGSFVVVGVSAGVINLLMLSGSFYMLQVYDRVLSSRSLQTLIGLSLLLLAAYMLQGFLDGVRVRLLARIGARFDEQVSPAAFAAAQKLPLLGFRPEQAMQPIRDLDQVCGFRGPERQSLQGTVATRIQAKIEISSR